jgi:hypothetical protein
MSEHDGNHMGQGARGEAAACLVAARHLRTRYRAADQEQARIQTATSRLLEAVALALIHETDSIPTPVRRAAAELARKMGTSGSGAERGLDDLRPRSTARRVVPFAASIRLGRMG